MLNNKKYIYKTILDLNKRDKSIQKTSEINIKDKDGEEIEVFRIITVKENFVSLQDYLYVPNHISDDGDSYDSIEEWILDIPHDIYNNLIAIVGEEALLDNFAVLKLMKDNNISIEKMQKWFIKRIDVKYLNKKAIELGYVEEVKNEGN